MIFNFIFLTQNSGYGSLLLDNSKHRNITYTPDDREAGIKVNDIRFIKLSKLEDSLYEIECKKRNYSCDLPIILGANVLSLAKLHLIEFYYNFIDKYFRKEAFSELYVDTDSIYITMSSRDYQDVVKPDLYPEFYDIIFNSCGKSYLPDSRRNFILRECCEQCRKYDSLTPGEYWSK